MKLPITSAAARVRRTAACAAMILLAACGSTAQPTSLEQAAAPSGADEPGLDAPFEAGELTPELDGGAFDVDGTGPEQPGATEFGGQQDPARPPDGPAAAPPDPGSATEQPPAGARPPAGAQPGPATGRGFTADEIYIGYTTWKDVSVAGSALGYAVNYGDQEAQARAIVKDLNDRGGIAGRKVVPVFYDYQTSDVLANPDRAEQSACSRLTEDRPVFALVAVTGIQGETLQNCLAKQQTPLIANTNIPYPASWFSKWAPYFYSTASPSSERYVRAWLQRAADIGYFSGWDTLTGGPGNAPVKVGILSSSSTSGQFFTRLVTEELARLGHKVEVTYELTHFSDQSGNSAAVLAFKSAGVTHVVPHDLNLLLFPTTAESQRYRPRYAISTAQAPILLQDAAPPEQMAGAVGAGYFPSYDVDHARDPGDVSPATAHCRRVQEQAGQDTTQREAWNLMSKACDGFYFLADALAGQSLSPQGLRQGANRLTSMQPAGAFAISFGAGRADGLAAVRDLGYRGACQCFSFLSATNHAL